MIITIRHCFIPITLPDPPTSTDVEDAMKKYNDYFDYYSNGSAMNSFNQDAMRMRFDTLAQVRNEIWEGIHEQGIQIRAD